MQMRLLKQLNDKPGGPDRKKEKKEVNRDSDELRKATRKAILDLRVCHEQRNCQIFECVYASEYNVNSVETQEVYARCLAASWEVCAMD